MFTTFKEAVAAKQNLLKESPDNNYQIKRRKAGGKSTSPTPPHDLFDLMQRVTSKEADQVIHRAQELKRKKAKRVKNYQSPV